jgi:hypothetical protein
MRAELTYTFESPEELAEFTAKLARPVYAMPPLGGAPVEMESVAVVDLPPAASTEPAPQPEPRPTKVRKITKAAGPDVPIDPTTEEQVRAAITAVNDKFGLVAARKVLRQFSANRIPDLKVEQYAEFVKACNAVK